MKLAGRLLNITWVVAFGAFMVLSFLPRDQKSDMAMNYVAKFEELLRMFLTSPWFFVFFIGMRVYVSFRLGNDSGWIKLASYFSRDYNEPQNSKFRSGSGYIGSVSHNGMLKVCAGNLGLYIKVMLPFRIAHDPLFIPWSEIQLLKTEDALVSNKTPALIRKVAAYITRTKYMKVVLCNHPDHNMVVHWHDDFNDFIPSSITRES